MRRAVLITPLVDQVPKFEDCDYIGVDAGALKIIEQNLPIRMAVGDFDSIDEKDLKKITCPIEKHPIMKDETDSELGIRLCADYDKVILYGGISGRIDHTIANIRLMMYSYPHLILMDDYQCIRYFEKGTHLIDNQYAHISFFPVKEGILSLEGFLYPLQKRKIYMKDIYTTSNSLIADKGKVIVENGSFICVQSNWR